MGRVSYVCKFISALTEYLDSLHKLLKNNILDGAKNDNSLSKSQGCTQFTSDHNLLG